MIFHTFHTMSLNRASDMFETDNIRLIARVWLPKWAVEKQYVKFMQKFDEEFGGREVSKAVKEESMKIALYNKIKNILPLLYLGLLYEETDYMKDLYKHYFGKDFEKGEDLLVIKQEIKRLSKRFKLLYDKKEQKGEGLTLDQLIVGIENILGRNIDRRIKLYQLKPYYEQSLKKIKDNG